MGNFVLKLSSRLSAGLHPRKVSLISRSRHGLPTRSSEKW
jgi:hypothetical protein